MKKDRALQILARITEKVARGSAGQRCVINYHQPKVPKQLATRK